MISLLSFIFFRYNFLFDYFFLTVFFLFTSIIRHVRFFLYYSSCYSDLTVLSSFYFLSPPRLPQLFYPLYFWSQIGSTLFMTRHNFSLSRCLLSSFLTYLSLCYTLRRSPDLFYIRLLLLIIHPLSRSSLIYDSSLPFPLLVTKVRTSHRSSIYSNQEFS